MQSGCEYGICQIGVVGTWSAASFSYVRWYPMSRPRTAKNKVGMKVRDGREEKSEMIGNRERGAGRGNVSPLQ